MIDLIVDEKVIKRRANCRKYHTEHREEINLRKRKLYADNKIYYRIAMKKWKLNNPEKYKNSYAKYTANNLESIKIKSRLWRLNNPEKVRKWNEISKPRFLKWAKEWKEKNPDLLRKSWNAKTHSRRMNAGYLTKKMIQTVYERNIKMFGTLTCCLCIKPILFGDDSLEHILPISRGGKNIIENLGVAHLKCNMRKRNKTLEEFIKWQ